MQHGNLKTSKVSELVHQTENDIHQLISNASELSFEDLALKVFEYQKSTNPLYKMYLKYINKLNIPVNSWQDIPCLPISLWRTQEVKSGTWKPELVFESSGTTGSNTSRQAVYSIQNYINNCVLGFEQSIGKLSDYTLLALLPNYLERSNSGLIAMVDAFLQIAKDDSGYFLYDYDALIKTISICSKKNTPIILWGVTFALLDLIKVRKVILPKGSIIIETGGMKGRGPELTKEQLYSQLKENFTDERGTPVSIQSEYGMTEMQSQAYLNKDGLFEPSKYLRVLARDLTDPFTIVNANRPGGINVYDLANIKTCSFIQTDDLGFYDKNLNFSIQGRIDQSIVRGCNLMLSKG